ncbi:MAG: acyl-CoA dehydratase activase [Eubacterium sp.]|jgi:predicted CoA-substrate-specific enzyme activase
MIYGMCKYTPVEVLAGFGEEFSMIEPSSDAFPHAEAFGHPNLCGYGKGMIEAAFSEHMDEIVLVNCCDVVRRVYDILKKELKPSFIFLIDLPHKRGKSDEKRFAAEIKRLIDEYSAYSGKSFEFRAAYEALIAQSSAGDAWHTSPGCENCEGACADTAANADTANGNRSGADAGSGKNNAGVAAIPFISLSGAHGGGDLADRIASRLTIPVRDDTCSGNRFVRADLEKPVSADGFISRYAHALLCQTPCMRMNDVSPRSVMTDGAVGVIYHTMKFCDYYGFEYASLTAEEGRPILKIETDGTAQSSGQFETRIEAFAESIGIEKKTGDRMDTKDMKYAAGIDSGSTSTEAVIMDRDNNIVAYSVLSTGAGAAAGAERALTEALNKAGLSRGDLGKVVSTGYGRSTIGLGDESITEITCHARGAHFLEPDVRTIVDIGGQDSKVIVLGEDGGVVNFTMNDKCAAGTGRFLEMMARTLELSMEDMSALGLEWKNDVHISSMCTVFAESEVVSLIAQNTPVPDIIHGLNKAIASRITAMVKRMNGKAPYMMTGGVALNKGVVSCMEKELNSKITVSPYAQLCGAIGACLLAFEE